MERVLTATGEVRTPYDPAALPILRAMPGARWDRDAKVWRVSISTADLPRTLECAERLRLEVAPELVAKLSAGTQETVAASARIDAIEARSGCRLYPFQRAGVDWLARRDRALLADDMGLGKTIQVLAALPEGARCLVVAPATLKLNWQAECSKWRPELRTAVLSGRGSFRWPREGELVIVNYDILPAECPAPPAGVVLVLDEAHMVKSYKAARSKRAKALQQAVVGGGGRCWFLTGTPLMNRPTDLYGVLEALGERALGGWPKFCALFNGWKNKWGGWEFGSPEPEVAERLRRCMVRRRKSEVLPDLPRKVRSEHWTNGISAGLQKTMDELWEDYRSELEADALPPFQCFSAMLAKMAEARIPDLLELVEQYEEQETPLVVFSAHRAPIDELGKREGWGTITGDTPTARRQEVVEQFQAGRLRGVACTIQAGGVGITLTRASHEIFVDRDWTPALNLQAEDRCCRIGQTAESVQVTVFRSGHVLSRHMERLLERKISMIEAAVERQQAALSTEHVRGVEERQRAREAREAAERARQEEIERKAREVTVADHMRRIESRAAGVAARAKGLAERVLTPELVTLLHRQIGFLYSQFDGAQTRDGAGFSKTDVSLGWSLAEMPEWTPEQARCAERLAIIYRRQLCAGMGVAA